MFGASLQIMVKLVMCEETRPLKMVSVVEAILSQMPSYGYWAAVIISEGLDLG